MFDLQKYKVNNPLEFEKIEADVNEWMNIPPLLAKYCIVLHEHLCAIISYNRSRSDEETTENLRKFILD